MRRVRSAFTSAVGAPLLLLLAYLAVAQLVDPHGYLGTDTGAKVATLDVMSELGTWSPEVPYWADELDPEGAVHAFYDARLNDRGAWVGVTTVPMLLLARPLYDVGGPRLALVVPMLGAVAAAVAARSLARRLGADDEGVRAFWAAGVATPVAVYALDFWEHAIGLALMTWGVVALADALLGRGPAWRSGLLAGLAFGVSFSMRTESVVFAAAGFAVTCVHLLLRRRVAAAVTVGASGVVSFGVSVLGGAWLEDAVHATSRSARTASTASASLADSGLRAREAVQTLLALDAGELAPAALLGGLLVVLIVVGTRAERRAERRVALVTAALAGVLLLRLVADGLGFVPGMLAASPLAVLGFLAADPRPARRPVLAMAVLPLPVVWATQYTGGAGPQWGGRYILLSGLLLAVLGVTALERDVPRQAVRAVGMLALLITVFGVAWTIDRTHLFDRYFREVVSQPEDVVISVNPFLPREAGPRIFDARFLSPPRVEELALAADVARRAGACRIGVVGWLGDPIDAARLGPPATLVEVRPLPGGGALGGFAVYDLCG